MGVEEYGYAYIVMSSLHELRKQLLIRSSETENVNV